MLREFEDFIGYSFRDKDLVLEALTHPSLSKDQKITKNYQRLEFLGDKVLGIVMAEAIFVRFKKLDEGQLSKRQAYLVCGEVCCKIAYKIRLNEFICMTESESKNGGRHNASILENSMEALIGAVYLDSSLENVRDFILKLWADELEKIEDTPLNPVASLQEFYQKRYQKLPVYEITETVGGFEAVVRLDKLSLISQKGFGPTHKFAKKQAAIDMLEKLKILQKI
jgi:ribonuclease III